MRTVAQRVRPCSLDAATQKLIANIFSNMFRKALENLGEDGGQAGWQGPGSDRGLSLPTLLTPIDVKMIPLGNLSKRQIARGFEALEALEAALRAPTSGDHSLEELSSHFYTVIPHNFGRSRPPPINSLELLQAKKDMLLVRAGRWAGSGDAYRIGQGTWGADDQKAQRAGL